MEKTEIAELVEYLSLIDGRQVTAEKIQAWNEVIGFLDYPTAREAVIQAQRDISIRYVEPKHIVAIALSIKEKRKTETAREKSLNYSETEVKNPMPKCVHNKGLLFCDTCCRNAAIQAGLIK
jgi:hypothetical protein